jgi:hypothetical protein
VRRAWNFSVYTITFWAAILTIVVTWSQLTSPATPDAKVAIIIHSIFTGVLFVAFMY